MSLPDKQDPPLGDREINALEGLAAAIIKVKAEQQAAGISMELPPVTDEQLEWANSFKTKYCYPNLT